MRDSSPTACATGSATSSSRSVSRPCSGSGARRARSVGARFPPRARWQRMRSNPTMRWSIPERYAELVRRLGFARVAQLQMVLPDPAPAAQRPVEVPAGFSPRCYHLGDEQALIALMQRAGFSGFGPATLAEWLPRALPDGYFVVADENTARLVATTLAAHHPSSLHPFGGELCWLAVDPDFRRRGLGRLTCTLTTRRLIEAGYRRIYLTTDDDRLAAIRLYLELGYVPFSYDATMPARWDAVYARLGRAR